MIHIGDQFYQPHDQLNSGVVFALLLIIFVIMVIRRRSRNVSFIHLITLGVFFLYLGVLLSLTIFPINLFAPNSAVYQHGFGQQMVISVNILDIFNWQKTQIIGNLLLFMPLTFLTSLLNRPRDLTRKRIATANRKSLYSGWYRAFHLSFLVSGSIELTQLVMSYFYLSNRVFDFADLILNTIGGLLGYLVFALVVKKIPSLATNL